MKKLLLVVVCSCLSNLTSAQSKFDSWAELKTFHTVMSQTFHPSEEGDLKPIRARAVELHEKSVALAKSKVPTQFDNDEIRKSVINLEKGCDELKTLVAKKGTDADVTKKLSDVHDVFHTIVEKCTHKAGDGHNHDGHNHDGHNHN